MQHHFHIALKISFTLMNCPRVVGIWYHFSKNQLKNVKNISRGDWNNSSLSLRFSFNFLVMSL